MDILKRSLAPVTDRAWKEIDDQATRSIKGNLSARRLVDFSGPHGWTLGAINTGRLEIAESKLIKGVSWGLRKALPLVEIRVPFALKQMEIDSVERGLKAPDLEPVHAAAVKSAIFEETALYHGFAEAGVEGIIPSSPHKAIDLGTGVGRYMEAVEKAVLTIQKAGIGGPYNFILGTVAYSTLMQGDDRGYPLKKRILGVLDGGDLFWSPVIEGGVVLSSRGGDFELTVGQDFSIGYAAHSREEVELYITETFTFQVLEPAAAVALTCKK